MSLESAVEEAKARYRAEQEREAREREESKDFAKRVDLHLRDGNAVVEDFDSLRTTLSEDAVTFIEALRRAFPGMIKLIVGPAVSSRTTLGGHVLVLDAQQPITQMAHVVNVKSPFAVTIASRLRNVSYTSARAFREKHSQRIEDHLRTLPREGPEMETHYNCNSDEDAQRWPVFFPAKRAHVGIYNAEDGGLYLVVRSHAGAEVLPGVRKIVSEAGTTAQSFVEDSRVKWMQNVAFRNAARLMRSVAKFLGFDVPTTHDYRSYSGPRRLTRYVIARPDIILHHDTQRMSSVWGTPRAVFFRDVVDGAQGAGDKVLVRSDVTKGYVLVDAEPPTDSLPIYPMTTDKIPEDERTELSVDERELVTEKISSLMPRHRLFSHYKYHEARGGSKLSPVVVVRS